MCTQKASVYGENAVCEPTLRKCPGERKNGSA